MAKAEDKYKFPECLHPVSAALHMMGLDPSEMVIELPRDAWWQVRCELDRRYDRGLTRFDGRGMLSDDFACMGVRFRCRRSKLEQDLAK